jgi:hypothetical protein
VLVPFYNAHIYEAERDNGSWQENFTMFKKRGDHQLVYIQSSTNTTGEQSNFASSLIFMLLIYEGA